MASENLKKDSSLLIPIIVAIITVLGGAIIAVINNWDKIRGKETQETVTRTTDSIPTQPKIKDQITTSFCDAVKALSQDAPNDFNNMKRKITSSDEDEDVWESIYQVNGIEIEIAFDKDDATTETDIEIYRGYDSIMAISSFNKYVGIVDACFTLPKGKLKESDESRGIRDRKSYWLEYRGAEYAVEIWLTISRNENVQSYTSVSILKKGKI